MKKIHLSRSADDDLWKASIAFQAKSIEEKIEQKYKFSCEPCKTVFIESTKMDDCFLNAKNLNSACLNTFHICEIAENFLQFQICFKNVVCFNF